MPNCVCTFFLNWCWYLYIYSKPQLCNRTLFSKFPKTNQNGDQNINYTKKKTTGPVRKNSDFSNDCMSMARSSSAGSVLQCETHRGKVGSFIYCLLQAPTKGEACSHVSGQCSSDRCGISIAGSNGTWHRLRKLPLECCCFLHPPEMDLLLFFLTKVVQSATSSDHEWCKGEVEITALQQDSPPGLQPSKGYFHCCSGGAQIDVERLLFWCESGRLWVALHEPGHQWVCRVSE